MLITTLEQLGLQEKEAKIYLASLSLGPSPVRKIAQKTGVNRGTCYDVLRNLMEQGLVSYYHQDKHKYFVAEDPAHLQDLIETQEENLKKARADISKVIPELKSIYDNAGDKPVAKYYEGTSGVKTILRDLLKSFQKSRRKEYYVYSAAGIRDYLYKAYPNFTRERIKEKIQVKVIAIGSGGRLCGLDERKWVSHKKSSPTYILIYQNKVALISVDQQKNPRGVIIEDEGIYKTQVLLFEKMWGSLGIIKRVKASGCGRCNEI